MIYINIYFLFYLNFIDFTYKLAKLKNIPIVNNFLLQNIVWEKLKYKTKKKYGYNKLPVISGTSSISFWISSWNLNSWYKTLVEGLCSL